MVLLKLLHTQSPTARDGDDDDDDGDAMPCFMVRFRADGVS